MFEKKYADRLKEWSEFRNLLETAEDPIQDTINFYNAAPLVSISTDPYNDSTWLAPWELLHENIYCSFSIILGIMYTLQLTDRFKASSFGIYIITDREQSEVKYLLYIDHLVVGYDQMQAVNAIDLPRHLIIEKHFTPLNLQ
jgi:hypothetical protein